MRARHWVHCTSVDHGPRFVADRRVPSRRPTSEADLTPRLCVCPCVAGCFAAVLFRWGADVHVYRTELPRRANCPRTVWDADITGERWLVPPVVMVRAETIPWRLVEATQCEVWLYHHATKKESDWKLRVAQYLRAMEVLGPRHHDRVEFRLVQKWWRRYIGGAVAPAAYILGRAII